MLVAEDLLEAGVVAAFTGRAGGTSAAPFATLNLGLRVTDDLRRALANRRRVATVLGLAGLPWALARQVHGATVLHVRAGQPGVAEVGLGEGPPEGKPTVGEADGLVTADPGMVLTVLTADCAPVLLADPAAGVVAAVHAGWRGLAAGVPATRTERRGVAAGVPATRTERRGVDGGAAPPGSTSGTPSRPAAPAARPAAPAAAAPGAAAEYEERKRDAAERKRRERAFAALSARIAELEARIAEREAEVKAVEDAIAAPGFYTDPAAAKPVLDRHQALMWEVGDLLGQWEMLQAEADAKREALTS